MRKDVRVNEEVNDDEDEDDEKDVSSFKGRGVLRRRRRRRREENNNNNDSFLMTAKMLGDTHYAYGSFGYGYYTPLPDGTAIFTPAFVPPPVPAPMTTGAPSSWG